MNCSYTERIVFSHKHKWNILTVFKIDSENLEMVSNYSCQPNISYSIGRHINNNNCRRQNPIRLEPWSVLEHFIWGSNGQYPEGGNVVSIALACDSQLTRLVSDIQSR